MRPFLKRGLILVAFFLGAALPMAAQSSHLVVFMNNGTEHSYLMDETDRIYFENNEKLIIEQIASKATTEYQLADIRKLICYETEGADENTETSTSLYPNPVHDVMVLRNLEGKQSVSIYTLDGRLAKAFEATGDQVVDVSDLAIGMYLVKTPKQTLKMIKL